MINKPIIPFLALVLFASSASSRDITLFRTIEGEYPSLETAQEHVSLASDIVEQDGKFYVVSGLYDKFQDALPENPTHSAWNTSWKHVLPVVTTVDDARQRGFTVPETLTRQAVSKPEFAAIPANKSVANLLRTTTTRVEAIEAGKAKPENELRRDMIAVLEPQLSNFIAIAERSTDREDAAFAQYWVAKTLYQIGVDLSVQRLPKTSFNQERHAWAEEELCYDSAMEAIDTYLERFPNTGKTEEIAYLKAATSYHLTYRGHHRHQV